MPSPARGEGAFMQAYIAGYARLSLLAICVPYLAMGGLQEAWQQS